MAEQPKLIEVRFTVPCTGVVNIDDARILRVFIWDSEPGPPASRLEGVNEEDYRKAVGIWLNADDCPACEFG